MSTPCPSASGEEPREKLSPVYAFLEKPSLVDFSGRLAAVFFVSGCNFSCGFCHNANLMAQRQEGLSWARVKAVTARFQSNWVDGAVLSGGEPLLNGGIFELLDFLAGLGWAVKLDTNGSCPEVLRKCLPRVDYVAMDIKAGLSRYAELTGFAETDRIAESVDLIKTHARDYEFRTTVIESFHDEAQMREIGATIQGARRYVLQPFVPREDLPDPAYRRMRRTSCDCMERLLAMMRPFARDVRLRGNT